MHHACTPLVLAGAVSELPHWPVVHDVSGVLALRAVPPVAVTVLIVVAVLGLGLLVWLIIRRLRRVTDLFGRIVAGVLDGSTSETVSRKTRHLPRSLNALSGMLEQQAEEFARFADEQAALRRVALLVASGTPPSEVFAAMAREIARVAGSNGATLSRFETANEVLVVGAYSKIESGLPLGTRVSTKGQNLAAEILRTGRPSRIDNYDDAPGDIAAIVRRYGVSSAVAVPVVVNGRLWGLAVASNRREPLPPGIERRISRFTDLLSTAIANAQARADLLASRARVVAATDQTRQRIERDLHDGTQQRLISLALDLRAAEAVVADQPELRSRISVIADGLADALEELREISRGIHPAILSEGGLRPALKALARRCPVAVDLDARAGDRLPPATEVAAYYFVAEALANVARHAHASFVQVRTEVTGDRLNLCVRDDGVGGANPAAGSGLIGLTDRIESLGGTIAINSPPGEGTRLDVSLPVGAE